VAPTREAVKAAWAGTVERLAWGGRGMARAEDGRLILLEAPLALFPGERVEAELRWKPKHAEGRVTGWLQRDPRRADAGCDVAESCGGCDLREAGLHAGELKRTLVEDLVRRQLPDAPPFEWLPAPPAARRQRIQVHWDGKALGFHRRASHALVPITTCPAAAEALSEALPRLLEALQARMLPTRAARWELATGTPPGTVVASLEDGRAWRLEPDGWQRTEAPLRHRLPCGTLSHGPGAFFQVCAAWAAEAFGTTLGDWGLEGDTLYDLYGGVGLFSALLGSRFKHRVLVEAHPGATTYADQNLSTLGLTAEVHTADVAEWLPESLGTAEDLILLDPPRAGLDPALAQRLLGASAGRLVLVGCDGAAFCRDLQRLQPAWTLSRLAFLDLFPWTVHVEGVALLERS